MRKAITIITSIVIALSILWCLINYFTHWEELLSRKSWFLINWKPITLLFLAYTLKIINDEV